ncbi:MAG: hypothetical protein K6E29_05290 [Cyanobacteria bacterium RUI128]|nr:hypothetical protein [Cyanobacteria bacterium RUI128]
MSLISSFLTKKQQMQGNLAALKDPDVVEQEIVDESQTVEKPIKSSDVGSLLNENRYTKTRFEQSSTTYNKVYEPSGDLTAITGCSIAPDVLNNSVSNNANTVVGDTRADIGAIKFVVKGTAIEIAETSLRTLRMNQDKYPDFQVRAMNIAKNRWIPHVTDLTTGYALNFEQTLMFINNVALPALT